MPASGGWETTVKTVDTYEEIVYRDVGGELKMLVVKNNKYPKNFKHKPIVKRKLSITNEKSKN